MQSRVDRIERNARPSGNPARIGAKTRQAQETDNHLGVLLQAGVRDERRGQLQSSAKPGDHPRRGIAALAQNLGKGGMIDAEIAGERSQGIGAIPLVPLSVLRLEPLGKIHGLSIGQAAAPSIRRRGKVGQTPAHANQRRRISLNAAMGKTPTAAAPKIIMTTAIPHRN